MPLFSHQNIYHYFHEITLLKFRIFTLSQQKGFEDNLFNALDSLFNCLCEYLSVMERLMTKWRKTLWETKSFAIILSNEF